MKAELNERNEVVVTMSRGEAQRVAQICDRTYGIGKHVTDSLAFSEAVETLGILVNMPINADGSIHFTK